jgi:hexosaminidase
LLWAEQAGPSNLDSIVWPRAAASAEVFWSGPGGDVNTALPRLNDIAYRFVQRGAKAIPLQPHWCALRPGACNMDPYVYHFFSMKAGSTADTSSAAFS